MNNNTKIDAFTLSEVLIVLVITSIVVTIAFSVLRLVTNQYIAMNKGYERQVEVLRIKQQLIVDLDTAYQTFLNEEGQQLLITNSTEHTFMYEWNAPYLIRDGDTLTSNFNSITGFLKGEKIDAATCDAIDISLNYKGKFTKVFVSRKQDARQKLAVLWD